MQNNPKTCFLVMICSHFLGDDFMDTWIDDKYLGQKFMSNEVPHVANIFIGIIFMPLDVSLSAPVDELSLPSQSKGANDISICPRDDLSLTM